MTAPPLAITLKYALHSVTVKLIGEIDIAVAKDVRDTVIEIVRGSEVLTSICIDTTGVTFTDSTGLRSLMQARLTALEYGLEFQLEATHDGPVVRLITLSGLDKWFGIPPATGESVKRRSTAPR